MKIIKIVRASKEKVIVNVNTTQMNLFKVLEKIGFLRILENETLTRTGSRGGKANLLFNKNLLNQFNINFVKGIPMSKDTVRSLFNRSKVNVYTGYSGKGGQWLKLESGVVIYIFSTEKGYLTQNECIKHGIGGKLLAYVTSKTYKLFNS